MNTKKQANIGVGKAISYFTEIGYAVSIPLTESQRYDLVVDDGEHLYRVEVKTSMSDVVGLRTLGGNQSWGGEVSRISMKDCDLVFVYSISKGNSYLFPSSLLEGRTNIKVSSHKYINYIL